MTETVELPDLEQEVLAIEREFPRYGGAKDDAIRSRTGMSATRYFQILNSLIDRPEVVERDPMLVGRLRRIRDRKKCGDRA